MKKPPRLRKTSIMVTNYSLNHDFPQLIANFQLIEGGENGDDQNLDGEEGERADNRVCEDCFSEVMDIIEAEKEDEFDIAEVREIFKEREKNRQEENKIRRELTSSFNIGLISALGQF